MKARILRVGLLAVVTAAALLAGASSAGAAAVTYSSSTEVPFHIPFWEASFCTHEIVVVDGIEHAQLDWVQPATGADHGHWLFNPHDVTGYGVVTGAQYRTTGVTGQSFSNDFLPPFVQTFESVVHLIGHATVSADGSLTATVDNFSVRCVQQSTT